MTKNCNILPLKTILCAMEFFKKNKKIHFIGVLGSSMSRLAVITKSYGVLVSGSDKNYSSTLKTLISNGIHAYLGYNLDYIKNADVVVYSSAIPKEDEELNFAKSLNKKILSRAEFLGILSSNFNKTIAISGTHGKSTVTAMLGEIFALKGLCPAVHLGGAYKEFEPFKNEYFITEACEYKQSFLSLKPYISVVLNVESDHPDCFSSLDEVYESFDKFLNNTRREGIKIIGENLSFNNHKKCLQIGIDAKATKIEQNNGFFSFVPIIREKIYPRVSLAVRGKHNVTNSLFVLLIADIEGVEPEISVEGLMNFTGVNRRYQQLGKINGAPVITDYAHHPTEILASIKTAKLHSNSVTVYFQPHTYSRTAKLFNEFLDALKEADKVIIVEEFPARETPNMGKSAKDLADALMKTKKCEYATLKDAHELLYLKTTPSETVLLVGAGNIDSIFNR